MIEKTSPRPFERKKAEVIRAPNFSETIKNEKDGETVPRFMSPTQSRKLKNVPDDDKQSLANLSSQLRQQKKLIESPLLKSMKSTSEMTTEEKQ